MNRISIQSGYVELIDTMTTESEICQIARLSTGSTGTNDEQLIEHLVKNGHNQVLEFGQLIFKIKCPIFVARQWQRYRTGSFNEMSGRYQKAKNEFYYSDKVSDDLHELIQESYYNYENELNQGTLMQDARQILPLATMTEFYWRTDCNNIMNFLKQRLHNSAQSEIREYAEAVHSLTAKEYPTLIESFDINILYGKKLNAYEHEDLLMLLNENKITIPKFLE